MKSQNQRLLTYLKRHKNIDPLTAWAKLGIYRLASRVYDLKLSGIKIKRITKKVKNRFGEECRVALYSLSK